MTNRLLHILNAEGDGQEAVFVDGTSPQNKAQKISALSEIVDYERAAVGKPSVWGGRLNDRYYLSGMVMKNGRTMTFSFCSPSSSKIAQGELMSDLEANSFTLDEQTIKYLSHKTVISRAVVGLCIALIVITGIILLCK
ncbi:MAG: hypothetical protein K6F58_01920 [Bacteroidales bacterium]|nr:hypothetical protein [Bacteroidales bacterium]